MSVLNINPKHHQSVPERPVPHAVLHHITVPHFQRNGVLNGVKDIRMKFAIVIRQVEQPTAHCRRSDRRNNLSTRQVGIKVILNSKASRNLEDDKQSAVSNIARLI